MTPPIATAAATGSSHCWIRVTAGSAARLGEGSWIHQVAVFTTIHRLPAVTACATLFRTPPAMAPDAERTAGAMTAQAGSRIGLQGTGMAVTSRR